MKRTTITAIIGITLIILMVAVMAACGGGSDTGESTIEETKTPGEGIITDSGLQYIEIQEGTGIAVKTGDVVAVEYTGTLEDGTKFDSSIDRGQPLSFIVGLGQMIAGFDEGIGLMKDGGKARLVIPPELGYGETGSSSGAVPPNATINFEVEVLSIDRPDPPQEVAEADYKVLDNGVKQYDFTVGEGPSLKTGETAVVNYTLWRGDGVRMEGTEEMGAPVLVTIGTEMVVSWFDEGISTMNAGGKRQMVIPPEVGFGDEGDLVEPNPTLIFEVELLEVIPVPETAEQTQVSEDEYTTTDSGLKYFDLKIGEGSSPETGQFAAVHYTGWLTDGTKFDSSLNSGRPLGFNLGMGQMIRGFDEGVATMKVGGKRQLVIPPELGYGDQGVGVIPPDATLVFEVELVYVY